MTALTAEQMDSILEGPERAASLLRAWSLANTDRAHANIVCLAQARIPLDLLAQVCGQLQDHLPQCSDADMALNNLERFVTSSRNPLALASLFERDTDALPILLRIFSTSQHLSDVLTSDKDSYELLRLTEGMPVARENLVAELCGEVEPLTDVKAFMAALRRIKRRETLRICYGDFVIRQRIEIVTEQISFLADALVEAAIRYARTTLEEKRGRPLGSNGQPAQFVVLAMGKLGGTELNYSSDIDLVFLYDEDGETTGNRSCSNAEFFDRLARDVIRLLGEVTEDGNVYRVDMRLRPEGYHGPVVMRMEQASNYYDTAGRTWERQAFIKARPIAGHLPLGQAFLDRLQPWIYRRYLSVSDIAGIKTLKRRIDHRNLRENTDSRDVKTGEGGLRDIEFVIQFLQLLNGGDLPKVRTGNTLTAIARLADAGCLSHEEGTQLESNYVFLRRIEHLLQIMLDLQTHRMPNDEGELQKLALRLGYKDKPGKTALQSFEADFQEKSASNRRILDHLLHDAFPDDAETEPEADLVLDPEPPADRVEQVLGKYGFKNVQAAHRHLQSLATEPIRFLSTRRCRHFLAAIASKLLAAIANTPDPDGTLVNLDKVSDSLGGKAVLWELFSSSPATLRLYVELCATSPFLSGILISNPGMVDELLDSLVLDRLPTLAYLKEELTELCRAAEEIDPILHSFKSAQQLRVGVRDILGKEDITQINRALSYIAQAVLEQVILLEYSKAAAKWGEPTICEEEQPARRCEWAVVAMGKFGGRELGYHSDLDLIFLYEGEGQTSPSKRLRNQETTSNQHFFSEVGARIIKFCGRLGPYGRLFDVDARLRPTGKSGALATTAAEFARYFQSGEGQLWERQSLCRARVCFCSTEPPAQFEQLIRETALSGPFTAEDMQQLRQMRLRLQQHAKPGDIKRGIGGLVDVEFIVQMVQLREAAAHPSVWLSGTCDALAAIAAAGLLPQNVVQELITNYQFLRKMESRLRLMSASARDQLPESPEERSKLARLLSFADVGAMTEKFAAVTHRNRELFDELCPAVAEHPVN